METMLDTETENLANGCFVWTLQHWDNHEEDSIDCTFVVIINAIYRFTVVHMFIRIIENVWRVEANKLEDGAQVFCFSRFCANEEKRK